MKIMIIVTIKKNNNNSNNERSSCKSIIREINPFKSQRTDEYKSCSFEILPFPPCCHYLIPDFPLEQNSSNY